MGAGAPSVSIGRLTPSDASMPTPSASIPPMRALAIVHQPHAGPGVFAEEMRERGVELDEWLLSQRGTGPPHEIAERSEERRAGKGCRYRSCGGREIANQVHQHARSG